jgi:diguanylate cyclase (GGDEF)-like protein
MGDAEPVSIATLKTLLDVAAEGLCLVEPLTGKVIYANSSLLNEVAALQEELQNSTVFDWFSKADAKALRAQLNWFTDGNTNEAIINLRPAGDECAVRPAEIRVRRVDTERGPLLAIAWLHPAVRGPSAARSGIDPLTGLADRAILMETLSTMVCGGRSSDHRCAVLFVDVDGFKQINDSYGHLLGDRVLREVAQRLSSCVRTGDHVARFGGDEFVILLERVMGRSEIDPVIQRIRSAFQRPISLPQGEVVLAVSIGVAEAGDDGRSAEELIDAADQAMYVAKRATA